MYWLKYRATETFTKHLYSSSSSRQHHQHPVRVQSAISNACTSLSEITMILNKCACAKKTTKKAFFRKETCCHPNGWGLPGHELVRSWILTSCQPHRIIPGRPQHGRVLRPCLVREGANQFIQQDFLPAPLPPPAPPTLYIHFDQSHDSFRESLPHGQLIPRQKWMPTLPTLTAGVSAARGVGWWGERVLGGGGECRRTSFRMLIPKYALLSADVTCVAFKLALTEASSSRSTSWPGQYMFVSSIEQTSGNWGHFWRLRWARANRIRP